MKFVDETQIDVCGGHGGAGCVAFLREKYRPRGGPSGGNGGNGGDVVLVVDPGLSTLLDFTYQRRLAAKNGEPGRGKHQFGARGADAEARVPPGTIVRDLKSGLILADLQKPGQRVVVAHGGHGGRGNATYATSTDQAPRRAQPGLPGEEFRVRLELRVMADVGLLGFPNAGKSTLIRRASAARPRVADYPFTTLVPHLGVVRHGDYGGFVMADIPGLIAGAHSGHGLGLRFLRHVSRTAVLLHLLDAGGCTGRDPVDDFDVINNELQHFDPKLAKRPQVVVANKADLIIDPLLGDELRTRFAARGLHLHMVSAATGAGVKELMHTIGEQVITLRSAGAAMEPTLTDTNDGSTPS